MCRRSLCPTTEAAKVVEVPFMIFLPNGMKSDTALARVAVTLAP